MSGDKRGRGRPRLDHVPVTARLTPEERAHLLTYGRGPSEAVRALLAIAGAQSKK